MRSMNFESELKYLYNIFVKFYIRVNLQFTAIDFDSLRFETISTFA